MLTNSVGLNKMARAKNRCRMSTHSAVNEFHFQHNKRSRMTPRMHWLLGALRLLIFGVFPLAFDFHVHLLYGSLEFAYVACLQRVIQFQADI